VSAINEHQIHRGNKFPNNASEEWRNGRAFPAFCIVDFKTGAKQSKQKLEFLLGTPLVPTEGQTCPGEGRFQKEEIQNSSIAF
jgi:hypothetical protein